MDDTNNVPGSEDAMVPESAPMTEEEMKKKAEAEAAEAASAVPEAPAEEVAI